MTYIGYLKTMRPQPDSGIEAIRLKFKDDANFTDTKNVKKIAQYVYNKLTDKQTTDFQKTLMYYSMESGINISLEDVNYVILLQNGK